MESAIFLAGHGSRDPEGTQQFLRLVNLFCAHDPERIVECGFLEFARPVISEGIERCVQRGARTIAVLPGMLMAAGHAKNDIPSEIHEARRRFPDVRFHYGRHLHLHSKILELCRLRLEEVERAAKPMERKDTLLLVVGRGSSDPDANANVAKVARFLQEGYPAGWSAVAFSGVTGPSVPDALAACERLGFRRIVVQPYFLFTGVLVKRIAAQVEERRRARPDIDYVTVSQLRTHPLLLEVFADRAEEALHGNGLMNCSLCQYRVPILGHEQHVGEPQRPHHHHVQGLHHHVHHLDEHHHAEGTGEEGHPWTEALRERLHFG